MGVGVPGPEVPGGSSCPAPPPSAPTSRWAIASFVFGLIGGFVLSVIFGIVALRRIPRLGQRGKPWAVAGLLLSALWVVGIAAAILIATLTGVDRDGDGRLTEPASISVFDVQVGDCLESVEADAQTSSLDGVPCSDPHVGEAVARFSLPEGAYPGDDAVLATGDDRCPQALAERVRPAQRQGLEDFYLYPTQTSWEQQDDREIVCIALSERPRAGSAIR